MKVSLLIIAALVASVNAFTPHITQLSRSNSARTSTKNRSVVGISVSNDDDETQASTSSRRSFLSHVVTATTAGTLSTLAITPQPATANSLAGQIDLPPMGLGAWAWGDPLFWGYDKKNDNELKQVFDYAVNNSKSPTTLLDTAELYGLGRSEELIGQFGKDFDPSKIQVATKFAALPFRTKATDVVSACEASLKRLGRPIDLYQIHFPDLWSNAEFWDGLAMAFDKGLVKAVGK